MRSTSVVWSPVTENGGGYRKHGPKLYRSILLYAGDSEIAADAVAEAFAQVLRRGDAIDSPERWVETD